VSFLSLALAIYQQICFESNVPSLVYYWARIAMIVVNVTAYLVISFKTRQIANKFNGIGVGVGSVGSPPISPVGSPAVFSSTRPSASVPLPSGGHPKIPQAAMGSPSDSSSPSFALPSSPSIPNTDDVDIASPVNISIWSRPTIVTTLPRWSFAPTSSSPPNGHVGTMSGKTLRNTLASPESATSPGASYSGASPTSSSYGKPQNEQQQKRQGGRPNENPICELASRLKYYPIVQIVSRFGASWYEIGQSVGFEWSLVLRIICRILI
jgi:hypothetical protein